MEYEVEKSMLSDKIRKVLQHEKNPKLLENLRFYTNYAALALKALRRPRFQSFLKWMMKREKIDEKKVTDIQVMVFPSCKDNGKGLIGKWNCKGQIFIYPKKVELFKKMARKFDAKIVRLYVKCRARAAVIHELLHAKYHSNEDEVRKLTKKYFQILLRNYNTENANKNKIFYMLFKNRAFVADPIVTCAR